MNSSPLNDFQACLSIQPKIKSPPVSKKAKQLAEELLTLVDGNSDKAQAIVKEILYYSPNQAIEWYYEQAINKLSRSKPNLVKV